MTILFKGSAEFRGAVHHRAVQLHFEIIRAEACSVLLCAIHAVGGTPNIGILVFTREHVVLLQRQLQCHAAQRNVVGLGRLVIAKGAVGIAPAGQMRVKPLHLVHQLAHSGVVGRLSLRQGAGIVVVEEAVLQLVAQNLLAGCVLCHVVQLQDGIIAVVVLADAEHKVEIIGGILLHMQRQRPGVLGKVLAVHRSADAILVVAGLALHQDADHRCAGKAPVLIGIAEIPQVAPCLAAVVGAAVIEAVGRNQRPVLVVVPEHIARIQICDAVRSTRQHRGLSRRRYAIRQRRNFFRTAVICPGRGRGPQQGEDHYQRHEQ